MRIAVWPDGDWCELRDVEEHLRNGKSDDYEVHVADSEAMAEQVAERVSRCQGGFCGV